MFQKNITQMKDLFHLYLIIIWVIFLSSFLSIIFNILITKLSNPTLFTRDTFRKEEDKLKSDKNIS